jgi:hypothetical protein
MTIGTLLGYLIGSRSAILTLAGHPRTWLIGMVFVLSAGFAREYDGEDLLHEPWHLLIPFGASLGSSFVLFCVLHIPRRMAGATGPPFFSAYRAFLSVFWMTAPLAWLYAVPYERLLDPVEAAYANVYTLALVSAWRVALMVRVGAVMFGLTWWASLFRVMAFADTVALIAINFLPFQVIEIMGGVRVSDSESVVRNAAQAVVCWGGCSLIVWWLLAFIAGPWALPPGPDVKIAESSAHVPANGGSGPVSWPLRIMVIASLAIWIPILSYTQPEQQLRWQVDTAFREGRIGDALAVMSAHEPDEFPSGWEPPPRFLKGESSAQLLDIWTEILNHDPAPWVRQRYVEKFKTFLTRKAHYWTFNDKKIAKILNEMPEAEGLLRECRADPEATMSVGFLDEHLRPELRSKRNPQKD